MMRHASLSVSLVAAFVALSASAASASPVTFFGENQSPGNSVSGAPLTAHNNFLASLTGVGTEEFEGFALNTASPLTLTFPGSTGSLTATLTGQGAVTNLLGAGRFDTTSPGGDRWWEVSGAFQIDFATPISAFGFYGTDIGDFNGQVTATLRAVGGATTLFNIPNTLNGNSGSLLFWGFIDPTVQYDRITFGNTNAGTDIFGFDGMTIGDQQQIGAAVPEPATLSLLGIGLGVSALRRRRMNRR